MGTARMRGVPSIPEKISVNKDVGSSVAAANSTVEDKDMDDAPLIDDDARDPPREKVDNVSTYILVLVFETAD
jgi:hypothetical protein